MYHSAVLQHCGMLPSWFPTEFRDDLGLMQTLCARFLWGELAALAHADSLLQPEEVTPEVTARRCAAGLPPMSPRPSLSFCGMPVGLVLRWQ